MEKNKKVKNKEEKYEEANAEEGREHEREREGWAYGSLYRMNRGRYPWPMGVRILFKEEAGPSMHKPSVEYVRRCFFFPLKYIYIYIYIGTLSLYI